jgi:hypothetical protein
LVGPQCVSQVGQSSPVGQDDRPVGAGARQHDAGYVRTGEHPAGEHHDAFAALAGLAQIERFAQRCLQAIDECQLRGIERAAGGQVSQPDFFCKPWVVGVRMERCDADLHPS